MSNEVDYLKWSWTFLMIPIGWLWQRLNKVQSRTDETRIVLAERHYTKLEVKDIVDRSVGPLHSKLNDIAEDTKYIIREISEMKKK